MRIVILGTIMHDAISTADGQQRESLGGILYNIVALLPLTSERDTVLPICRVGADHRDAIMARHLAAHRRVETPNMLVSPAGSDTAELRYRGDGSRDEQQAIRTASFAIGELDAARDAHLVIVNPVGGHELDLSTMRQLRKKTRAHIHLDVHSLAKRRDAEGRLACAPLTFWREWLACVDSVQANDGEVAAITGAAPATEEEIRRATLVLASPPHMRAAIVTLGDRGCALASRLPGESTLHYIRIPALAGLDIVDTTGCGDVFASAFALVYERRRKPLEAALVATAMAGLNATGGGLEALATRTNAADVARAAFPALWVAVDAGWPGETIDEDEVFRAVSRLAPVVV